MDHDVIDKAIFNDLCDSTGADFVQELVDTFLEEAPGLLGEMHAAHAAGSADAFRRAAHSLKSNAMTFGARHLGDLAREFEHRGLPDGGFSVQAMEAALSEAAQALRALCRG